MTLELVKDRETWDTFVDESPHGLLFHKWDYITITAQHTGYRLLPYGVYKGDELVCLAPLYFRSTHGVKTLFSPPPMQAVIPYQGFILSKGFGMLKQSKREAIMDLIVDDLSAEIDAISPLYLHNRPRATGRSDPEQLPLQTAQQDPEGRRGRDGTHAEQRHLGTI
jgi:hypothetical protein